VGVLSAAQRDRFLEDGFVLVEGAFDRVVADECCARVWEAVGRHARGWSSPDHPVAWFDNFVHLQYGFGDGPFATVATPRVRAALDDLLGAGRWTWNENFGWWPVLFPGFAADKSAGDLWWHVDSDDSYPTLRVPEKAVVTLFYFSDVAIGDGGTAVLPGSHTEVARLLAEVEPTPLNDEGVRPRMPVPATADQVVEVTGGAGDVLFAHPFLVHASNRNTGRRVRFACNPHVDLLGPLELERPEAEQSLVENAVSRAIAT
jgi:hypothetical protein